MRYEQIWDAVDKLARLNGLTPSGLAKKAGLDATTFNKSKRLRPDGNKRFPSLESINKITAVSNITFEQFCKLADMDIGEEDASSIPYVRISELEKSAAEIKFEKLSKIKFPDARHNLYALEVDDKSTSQYPLGTMLIISRNSEIRRGDKILASYKDGNIYLGSFIRRTASSLEVQPANGKNITLSIKDLNFINRILWTSQ